MSFDLSPDKQVLFEGIKQRMKTWELPSDDAVKPEIKIKIGKKLDKDVGEITFWDFLCYSYGVDDKTSIKNLFHYLAFEYTVVNPTNQFALKMLSLLIDEDGGQDSDRNALKDLLNSKTITAQSLIRG
jgi:hypothetical protein